MSTYVISDIHGNSKAWEAIKEQIKLGNEDELYILGDVIDRGEGGIAILQEIMNTPNMHMLLGNHELMMLNALGLSYTPQDGENYFSKNNRKWLWMRNGGKVTLDCYKSQSELEKTRIQNYLKALPLSMYVIVNGVEYIMVHANWERLYDMVASAIPERRTSFCVWDRENLEKLVAVVDYTNESGRPTEVVVGHTPTLYFDERGDEFPIDEQFLSVYKNGHLIAMDCGAGWGDEYDGKKGRLACLRLDDMKAFYSES